MRDHQTGNARDTVHEAMKLIDPSGTLVPGTEAYDAVRGMVLEWIDQCGPDYALDMAERSAKHLDLWLKC